MVELPRAGQLALITVLSAAGVLAACEPPSPQDAEAAAPTVASADTRRAWAVLPHAPLSSAETSMLEALGSPEPREALDWTHAELSGLADESLHFGGERELDDLRRHLQELDGLLSEKSSLSDEERAEVEEEYEQRLAEYERLAQEHDEQRARHEAELQALEELLIAARGRLELLGSLGELLRARLEEGQEALVEHGAPFGGGGIPEEWFQDCVGVIHATEDGFAVNGSGVLVGPRVVLTARHVVDEPFTHVVFTGLDVDSAADDQLVEVLGAEVPDGELQELDVAALILATPLDAPITDRAHAELYEEVLAGSTDVFVAGYGTTHTGESGRKTGGTFIADRDASWVDPIATELQEGREIILIDSRLHGRVDTAGGDSGGPAYFLDDDGQFALGAITSRGVTPHNPALYGSAGGVYVRLDVVESWLDEVLQANP